MANTSGTWPTRETMQTMAWVLSTKENIGQVKRIIADSKESTDEPTSVAASLRAWVEGQTPANQTIAPIHQSLLLTALDVIDWHDIATHVLELYPNG